MCIGFELTCVDAYAIEAEPLVNVIGLVKPDDDGADKATVDAAVVSSVQPDVSLLVHALIVTEAGSQVI